MQACSSTVVAKRFLDPYIWLFQCAAVHVCVCVCVFVREYMCTSTYMAKLRSDLAEEARNGWKNGKKSAVLW